MSDWKRGRKKATPEQKKANEEWHKERVKIINLIRRKPEIKKICCICGKPGKILHNRQDPYYITFICDECKKDKNNLIIAEENRFDVRTKLDKDHLSTHNFTDEEVVRIVVGFMNGILSKGEYCNKIGISRYQFDQIVKRYKQLFPRQNIQAMIKKQSNKIKSNKFKKLSEERDLYE